MRVRPFVGEQTIDCGTGLTGRIILLTPERVTVCTDDLSRCMIYRRASYGQAVLTNEAVSIAFSRPHP